jgi:hypothetical protein
MSIRRTLTLLILILCSGTAYAQGTPSTPTPTQKPIRAAAPREPIAVRGFGTLGNFIARSSDTFETVLGTNAGLVFGGGAQVVLPSGVYVEVSASRFHQTGERVFVGPNQEIFRLGIPLTVTITPLEITGGWRYRHCPPTRGPRVAPCRPAVVPYVGAGLSSYRYQETSEFENNDEDVDERFAGYHVVGGIEYRAATWLAVGGEFGWSTVPDAIGDAGVSAAFNESDLGGMTLRLKVSVGR